MTGIRRRLTLATATTALLLAGCSSNDDSGAAERTAPPETTVPTQTSTPTTASPQTPEAAIDPCLIGRWRQDSMSQQWTVDDDVVEVEGWIGRILEFQPDGTEIVTYDDATPMEADTSEGPIVETWSGVAVYEVSTSGDLLSFESVDFSDTSVVHEFGDETVTFRPQDVPSPPVTYTCNDSTHTQQHETYEASFTRID